MSAGKEPADRHKISRLPAPSLFVGPPSRNASNLSLATAPKEGSSSRQPLNRQRSYLGDRARFEKSESAATPSEALNLGGFSRRPGYQSTKAEQQSNERTDALWAEMQNTLEEVELSATSGTHVFGPNHSKALEELRTAQISLAQAWAKSETEDEPPISASTTGTPARPANTADILSADRKAKLGSTAAEGHSTTGRTQLEEDTENDIALARKRREENDAYFQRVNKGVLEVVQKLEEVAKAMQGVEMESKEIWGDRDSVDNASIN